MQKAQIAEVIKQTQENCDHVDSQVVKEVFSEGKNKGKKYWACTRCKKFIKWYVDELPLQA